jgi:hypothetical protein
MSEIVKMEISRILEEAKNINVSSVAEEILTWLTNNVENYVDNRTKTYKINLVIDTNEMPMTKKLQDLYGAIPDDDLEGTPYSLDQKNVEHCTKNEKIMEEGSKCRRELDKIVERVYEEINNFPQQLDVLFKRLIFFYEKIIMNPDNKKRALEIDEELKALIYGKEDAPVEEKKKIQEEIVKLIKEGESLIKYEEFSGVVTITKFDYEAFSVGVTLSSKPTEEEIELGAQSEVMKEYVIPEGFVVWMEISYKLKVRPASIF